MREWLRAAITAWVLAGQPRRAPKNGEAQASPSQHLRQKLHIPALLRSSWTHWVRAGLPRRLA